MKNYGEKKLKNSKKGKIVIGLADSLKSMVENDLQKMAWNDFEVKFTNALNDEETVASLSKYRLDWKSVIANVLFALTGLGAIVMAIYAGATAYSKGKPLAFFQKEKTTSEKKRQKIEKRFNELKSKK